jgi:hypothetical protein
MLSLYEASDLLPPAMKLKVGILTNTETKQTET